MGKLKKIGTLTASALLLGAALTGPVAADKAPSGNAYYYQDYHFPCLGPVYAKESSLSLKSEYKDTAPQSDYQAPSEPPNLGMVGGPVHKALIDLTEELYKPKCAALCLDEIKTEDGVQKVKYLYEDCSTQWVPVDRKLECKADWCDEYRLNNNDLERKYQYADCITEWKVIGKTIVRTDTLENLIDKINPDVHDPGLESWVTPDDPIIKKKFKTSTHDCLNKAWKEMKKVKYCDDETVDVTRPARLLEGACGVCSDQSGLMVSILRACGYKPENVFVAANDQHAIVAVKYYGEWMYFDPSEKTIEEPPGFKKGFTNIRNDVHSVYNKYALQKGEVNVINLPTDGCVNITLLNSSIFPLIKDIVKVGDSEYAVVDVPENAEDSYRLEFECDPSGNTLAGGRSYTTYKKDGKIG